MHFVLRIVLWYPLALILIVTSFFILYKSNRNNSNSSHINSSIYNFVQTPTPAVLSEQALRADYRYKVLNTFLTGVKSPLSDHVDDLIQQADANGIDYTLIPAISMQESQACKIVPIDSFNCWGYGIYGSNIIYFDSYKQAITQVAKTIKETYIKKGITNPTLLEDRWAPQSRGIWSYSVNFYISKIKEIERNSDGT